MPRHRARSLQQQAQNSPGSATKSAGYENKISITTAFSIAAFDSWAASCPIWEDFRAKTSCPASSDKDLLAHFDI